MIFGGLEIKMKMDDIDSITTISSTKSSLDSGFDNGFLSDISSSSSKSDCDLPKCQSRCVFEENTKEKTYSKYSYHYCALNLYNKSGRCIETMSPRTFLYLSDCVRVLDLSKNKIKVLPETISELKNLQELNLSHNDLVSLPDSCNKLQKLLVLNLSQNKFCEPPLCLELGMEQITILDLSRNMISNFPKPPKCSRTLQNLNLSRNSFNSLPLWLFSEQCRSILELDVSFNFCFDDPTLRSQLLLLKHHRTSALKSLKKLSINNTGNNLGIVSPLSSFESVRSLHIGNLPGSETTRNHFSEFKVNLLSNPNTLVELHFPNIGLAGLPEDIYRFTNLEVLDASHNPLDWLPETFGLLRSLRELTLSECSLSYFPENFGQLKSLKKLILDHNKLTDVRDSLDGLPELEWLDVYDNCLEDLPVSPKHLLSLLMVDLSANYMNLEVILDCEVNNEKLFDVYCRQQARLREVTASCQDRTVNVKVTSNTPSWDSLESLYKSYRSNSLSDLSQGEESYQCYNNQEEDVPEESWDEDLHSDNNDFDPNSIHRFHLPVGRYQFGWMPPVKHRECPVPINQQVSGFVFIPGQLHQKTTIRKRRKKVKDCPVFEGQFDDVHVGDNADLQKAESLGELLRRMYMFIRNPGGLRCKRRCRFHSIYEDCLHHGLWFRLSPPVSFECPEDNVDS